MAEGKILNKAFFYDIKVRSMDRDTRDVFQYLITGPEAIASKSTGMYSLDIDDMVEFLKITHKQAQDALLYLTNKDRIHHIDGWIWVVHFLRHETNAMVNDWRRKGIVNQLNLAATHCPKIAKKFASHYRNLLQRLRASKGTTYNSSLINSSSSDLKPPVPGTEERKDPLWPWYIENIWSKYPKNSKGEKILAFHHIKTIIDTGIDTQSNLQESVEHLVQAVDKGFKEANYVWKIENFFEPNNELWRSYCDDYHAQKEG